MLQKGQKIFYMTLNKPNNVHGAVLLYMCVSILSLSMLYILSLNIGWFIILRMPYFSDFLFSLFKVGRVLDVKFLHNKPFLKELIHDEIP